MGDAFDCIRDTVCIVVGRIDAPLSARLMMFDVPDAIEHRIAHIHIRRCHVDLCTQTACSVGKITRAHTLE